MRVSLIVGFPLRTGRIYQNAILPLHGLIVTLSRPVHDARVIPVARCPTALESEARKLEANGRFRSRLSVGRKTVDAPSQ